MVDLLDTLSTLRVNHVPRKRGLRWLGDDQSRNPRPLRIGAQGARHEFQQVWRAPCSKRTAHVQDEE